MEEKRINNRFTVSFGNEDTEAAEWLDAQPDKSAYLKALLLEDMRARFDAKEEIDSCGKQDK